MHEGVPLAVIEAKDNSHALDAFPSPEELWRRYCRWRGFTAAQEQVARQPYSEGASRKDPGYPFRARTAPLRTCQPDC